MHAYCSMSDNNDNDNDNNNNNKLYFRRVTPLFSLEALPNNLKFA